MMNLATKQPLESTYSLIYQFWHSAILRAALKLNIFVFFDQHKCCSSDNIAKQLNANFAFMHSFLEACHQLGLLEKENTGYTNSIIAKQFFIPTSKQYIGDLAMHITNHWQAWGKLDQLIIHGSNELPFETDFVSKDTYWQGYMQAQHNRAQTGQADNLVKHVDLTNAKSLLDLGGGIGSYSIALCQAYPHLHADIVDQKEPLAMARKLVAENHLSDHIHLLEADIEHTTFHQNYDAVLISGVICIQSASKSQRLFTRAYQALSPDGTIIIQDFIRLQLSHERDRFDALMDIYLRTSFDTSAGNYQGDDVVSWLQNAGFKQCKTIPLATQLNLILAKK